MKQSFDNILNECIRQLEAAGGDIESVLSKYPEQADELRPYLQVWASLSAVEKVEATPESARSTRQRLLSGIAKAEQTRGGVKIMPSIGVSTRFLGVFAAGAALALGALFFTGNLDFGSGSTAQADAHAECVLALDFDGSGSLGVGDVEAFRTAIETQDLAFDLEPAPDGDGDVDVFDAVAAVMQVVACVQDLQSPAPTPPPTP
jgi:hypothetical protein